MKNRDVMSDALSFQSFSNIWEGNSPNVVQGIRKTLRNSIQMWNRHICGHPSCCGCSDPFFSGLMESSLGGLYHCG